MRIRPDIACLALIGSCLGDVHGAWVARADTPAAVIGNFFSAPDGPVIAIAECGADKLCGRIVGLGKLPATDVRNPNAAVKGRNLCGQTVLTLTKSKYARPDRPHWEGQMYHAEKGTRYNVFMSIEQDEHLFVSGTTGDPMLARSFPFGQIWERAQPSYVACSAPLI